MNNNAYNKVWKDQTWYCTVYEYINIEKNTHQLTDIRKTRTKARIQLQRPT